MPRLLDADERDRRERRQVVLALKLRLRSVNEAVITAAVGLLALEANDVAVLEIVVDILHVFGINGRAEAVVREAAVAGRRLLRGVCHERCSHDRVGPERAPRRVVP